MNSSIVTRAAENKENAKEIHPPLFKVVDISKSFPSTNGELLVLDKLSLRVAEGELVTIFGPNGCGKTTLLNVLAGIIEPDAGKIVCHKDNPETVSVGYVFQNYADTLLPWRTVRSNIAFPLEVRNYPEDQQNRKIDEKLEQFRLTEHSEKYIYQLSGGLKQSVAIARATVYDPRLLLLDEPFSALDYSLSRELWMRFREIWTDLRVTTVFVSHNVDEAVFLGDKVYVMSSRPASVVAEVVVPFGRSRNLDLLTSHEFFSVRGKVLEAFEQGKRV